MPRKRDPFPYPKHDNDYSFTGTKQQQKESFEKPTHMAQNDEPWCRLNERPTLASIRRSVMYSDHKAPRDSLDFHLKSVYDQHEEFLRGKNQTLYQRETLTKDHGRIFNCRWKSEEPCDQKQRGARVWSNSQKNSIYTIEGTIESHHNASTNRGYSRKHDGGFYST